MEKGWKEIDGTSTNWFDKGQWMEYQWIWMDGWMYLFVAQIEEFLEFNATVRKSPESSLFLELCGEGGVGY